MQTFLILIGGFLAAIGFMDLLLLLCNLIFARSNTSRPILTVYVSGSGEHCEYQLFIARIVARLLESIVCRTVLVVDSNQDAQATCLCRRYCEQHGELLYCKEADFLMPKKEK
ncbi:MAG: hypothetical protein IJC55_04645 [Clostridia bacterium]|nr:hypothetical protein [Clostridia bacterium]